MRKTQTIIILACLVLGGCATFKPDPWTKGDISKEAAWLVLHAADWSQTRYAMDRPDEFKEINPLLGSHPSKGRINTFMGVTALGHILLTHYLDKEERPIWQWITIGLKICVVGNNFHVGAKMDW